MEKKISNNKFYVKFIFHLRKHKCICISVLIALLIFLRPSESSKNGKIEHLIIYSGFYYNVSKFYASNSMILLVNAEKILKINDTGLHCYSQNRTSRILTKAQIRVAAPPTVDCSWEFFILNCTTVLNPDNFGLTTTEKDKVIKVEFELPEREQFPVVMCYPPMVYESRWQQLIFAIEIYHHFGADFQVQYVNSAKKEIMDLLKIYEKKKWIALRMFSFFDFNSTTIASFGVHPMLELTSRNQPTSYTDCLMKYRESAEFVIVADVDDVLIPRKSSYFLEFAYWSTQRPSAASFFYFRKAAIIDAAANINNFSLSNSIKSMRISNETIYGKTVYRTPKSEAAWIHTPGMLRESNEIIAAEDGIIYHIQINEDRLKEENLDTFKLFKIMPNEDIERIDKEFISDFSTFPSFNISTVYADAIFKCYNHFAQWISSGRKTEMPLFFQCINPLKCEKPKLVPNFECIVARRDFDSESLTQNLVLHNPKANHYWWRGKNGCTIFLE